MKKIVDLLGTGENQRRFGLFPNKHISKQMNEQLK